MPLTDLTTGAPAGVFTFQLRGQTIAVHKRSAAQVAAASDPPNGGGGEPGALSDVLSASLDVYAKVLDAAGDSGKIADFTATLPAVEPGSGEQLTTSQPIASTYKGTSASNEAISLELTDAKTQIKHVDVSTPPFSCAKPPWSITAGDESVDVAGPVVPPSSPSATITFSAFGQGDVYYYSTGGEKQGLAGFYIINLIGAFSHPSTVAGQTTQTIEGTLSLTDEATTGPAVGVPCMYTVSFAASAVVTGR